MSLFLTLIARPLAVLLCLLPFRFEARERLFISWVGLRGAVPIILASYPVLEGVPGAGDIFNLVFFVVVVNALLPGATVGLVTRRLALQAPQHPVPSALLEIHSTQVLDGEILAFYLQDALSVTGSRIADIPFPEGTSALLLIRDSEPIAARGATVLRSGDHVYVFCRSADRPLIELLFGRPQDEPEP